MPRLTDRPRFRPELLGGLGRAMSSRNYRFYALGHLAHVHGWWGNKLGIGWLTWELTGSAGWLGIIAFTGMIPVMVVAPFGGALLEPIEAAPIRDPGECEISKRKTAKNESSPFSVGLTSIDVAVYYASDVTPNQRGGHHGLRHG